MIVLKKQLQIIATFCSIISCGFLLGQTVTYSHISLEDALLEPESVVSLDLSAQNIADLTAITTFKNLEILNVEYNPITCGTINSFKTEFPNIQIKSTCFDEVYYANSSNPFLAGKVNGRNVVINTSTKEVLAEDYEKYYVTGCDALIITTKNKIAFNYYRSTSSESFNSVDDWISYETKSPIAEVQVGHCEFDATEVIMENGSRYHCAPFDGIFVKKKSNTENQTICEKTITKLDLGENYKHTKNALVSFYSICECDENALQEVNNCIEKLTKYPTYYTWNPVNQSCELKKFKIITKENLSKEDKEACLKLLSELKTKSNGKNVSLEELLKLEAMGCLIIEEAD